MGTLYVVATPIGNVEDLSPRAQRILSEVSVIAAEDTRHSGAFLRRLGISTPLLSYHAFNERRRETALLEHLERGDVALISDAGTPAISDPGARLVRAAGLAGHEVIPIPGPSALTAAISASGLIDGPFVALGFLPRSTGDRARILATTGETKFGVAIFEAPTRLGATLAELNVAFPGRQAVVFRELTKRFETSWRGELHDLARSIAATPVKGECVIVIGPAISQRWPRQQVERELTSLLEGGMGVSAAARQVAAAGGWPKSEAYHIAIKLNASESQQRLNMTETPTSDGE